MKFDAEGGGALFEGRISGLSRETNCIDSRWLNHLTISNVSIISSDGPMGIHQFKTYKQMIRRVFGSSIKYLTCITGLR